MNQYWGSKMKLVNTYRTKFVDIRSVCLVLELIMPRNCARMQDNEEY